MALTGTLLADFSAFVKEAGSASFAVKDLQTSANDAAQDLSKFGSGFDLQKTIKDPIGSATDAMKTFGESLGPVGSAAVGVTTTVVALGAALFGLAESAAETVAKLDDLHDKTGLSVPVLSQLSNAAKVIGADMGQLTDVVFKLEKGIGENTDKFQAGLTAMGLSTNELKAAGPDRYLELVTAGLQSISDPSERAAAGAAVLGKGYKDVAHALNDLGEGLRLTADIDPFTAQQAADAEAFTFQIASMKTHISATATAFGNELIPAASATVDVLARVGLGLVHIADAGGLVSGAWQGIKDTIGEAALKQETFNAVAGTTNRLFMEQGATAASVAEKLLALGYSEKTVAEQTGLTAEAVRKLNGDLTATKTAAEDYAKLWDDVNKKLAEGAPTLEGVSSSTRGLVKDMLDAGVSIDKVATATDLSVAQVNLLKKGFDEAGVSAKAWAKASADATAELASAGDGWKGTLDTINGAVVESIISYRNAGVSMKALGVIYSDLSDAQKASIEKEIAARQKQTLETQKQLDEQTKLEAKTIDETTKLWDAYEVERVKHMGTVTDIAKAENAKQYNDAAANANKMGIVDAQYWDALEARWKQKNAAIGTDWAALTKAATTESKAGLQQIADGAQATYQEALKHVGVWSDASIEKFRTTAEAAQKAADMFGTSWADNADKAKKKVDEMAASTIGQIHAIAAASASATIAQGATQPYPDTAEGRLKQLADEQARYGPGTVINTSGLFGGLRDSGGPVTAGKSYLIGGGKAPELFTPGASGFVTPGGGAGGVVTNIYVTQPLGTPDAIARAVADAQIAMMKGQGARLPYGG
jgi:hypothetical protein